MNQAVRRAALFLGQEEDRRRLPVAIISGFLGSGKTTLVNALLADPLMADTAVAVNEFGEVPLDHHLLDQGRDRTVVMANGCLCCTLAGDMETAVMRLFSRREQGALPRFRRLIVEPSGLADPAPIAQAILRNPFLSRALRLEAMVTTVDAVFAERHLARYPETRKQIALADRLVLTKTDLIDAASQRRVTALLKAHHPVVPLLAVHGAVAASALLPPGFLDPAAGPERGPEPIVALAAPDPVHTADTASLCLTADQPLRWRAVEAWLRNLRIGHADRLLRLKGFLNLAEATGPVVIQGIHHVLHAPVELARWPDADHTTRIVLILEAGLRDEIAAAWTAALPRLSAGP